MHYCPGCGHGTVHSVLAEVIEEEDLQSRTIGITPVGCSVLMYNYLDIDFQEAAHGRAPALATAVKRLMPEKFVFTYQGDGDLAAIGTAETIHTCNRGENILMLFINNGIYGMTGGQMAPTTLEGMKSSTSPYGRDVATMGSPIKMADIVAMLPGTCYVTRQSVNTAAGVKKLKRALKKAVAVPEREERNLFHRGGLKLPLGMEDDPGGIKQVDGGEHVPVLSAWRHKGSGRIINNVVRRSMLRLCDNGTNHISIND